MSSQVNPATIDASFPVAGVNQPSQGFRSNFLAIFNAFSQYVTEMNDLINKSIVSAPLTYGGNVTVNNFGGMQNSNLAIYDYALVSASANNISASSVLTVDISESSVYPYILNQAGTTQTVNLINFPNLGYSEVILDITVNAAPQFINLATLSPSSVISTSGNIPIAGYNNLTANLCITNTSSPTIIKLASLDGVHWILSTSNFGAARTGAPGSAIGSFGDTKGMIAIGNNNIYVCNGNYDGTTHIWQYAALTSF